MNLKLYLSIPIAVDRILVHNAVLALRQKGYIVNYWKRGEPYSDKALREADAVLFFGGWSWNLPIGCKTEYKLAEELGLPVFLLYCNSRGEHNMYSIEEGLVQNKNVITGLSGTSFITPQSLISKLEEHYEVDDYEEFKAYCNSTKKEQLPTNPYGEIVLKDFKPPDRRLLLLLI